MSTAIARRTASPVPVLQITNFADLVQFSQMAAKSKLVPPDYRGQPESVMLAVQLGSELGLSPMQSIQNIAVIGSRPTVWGDAMLALVLAHPDCEDVVESTENNDTAVCTVKRRGRTPVVRRFSVADAKLAQLWGKSGPWTTYPSRMLQMRARGFALRDAFPDTLKGLISAEEARDIPPHNGPTLDAVAEPARTTPTALTVVERPSVGGATNNTGDNDGTPAPANSVPGGDQRPAGCLDHRHLSRGDTAPATPSTGAAAAVGRSVGPTDYQGRRTVAMSAAEYLEDGIPALDDMDEPWPPAEPAPMPAPASSSLRAEINAAVPLRQPKPTVSQWLDELAAKLDACTTREQAEAAILCEQTLKAGKALTGEARQRLRALIDASLARFSDEEAF